VRVTVQLAGDPTPTLSGFVAVIQAEHLPAVRLAFAGKL